jgi:hypothetical protein
VDKKKDAFSTPKKEPSIIKLGFLSKKLTGLRAYVEDSIYT